MRLNAEYGVIIIAISCGENYKQMKVEARQVVLFAHEHSAKNYLEELKTMGGTGIVVNVRKLLEEERASK